MGAVHFESVGFSFTEAVSVAVSSNHAVLVAVASARAPRVGFLGAYSRRSLGAGRKLSAFAEGEMGLRKMLAGLGFRSGKNVITEFATAASRNFKSLDSRAPAKSGAMSAETAFITVFASMGTT